MQILVNGESKVLPTDTSLASLIRELRLEGRLAVEINHEIVPRSQFEQYLLQDGDRVEIVHAIGGG